MLSPFSTSKYAKQIFLALAVLLFIACMHFTKILTIPEKCHMTSIDTAYCNSILLTGFWSDGDNEDSWYQIHFFREMYFILR